MSTFNTKTLITWASYEDQNDNIGLDTVRLEKLQEMITAGKTNGEATVISPTVTTRYFLDVPSAQEYIYFIQEQATVFGVTIISAKVLENAI